MNVDAVTLDDLTADPHPVLAAARAEKSGGGSPAAPKKEAPPKEAPKPAAPAGPAKATPKDKPQLRR